METRDLIMRNIEAAQYIYAAKKNFIERNGITSESHSKILIGHFSDMHGDIERFENCLKYFEYFNADFAIHTGDCVKWDMRDNSSFIAEADKTSKVPLYNCIGNHETFEGDKRPTNEELHERILSTQKNMKCPDNRGYYYVDFDKYKFRLIVINNYDYDEEGAENNREAYVMLQPQCDWLIKTLKDAAEMEYAVVIASHECDIPIPPGSNDYGFCQRCKPHPWGLPRKHEHIVADIVDAFKHGKEIKLDFEWASVGSKIFVDDKFDKKGEFVCYLNGHLHGDYVGFLPEFSDQLSIGMPCSGCEPPNYHNIGEETSDLTRIPGTVTEDVVNFYTIDREKKTISIVRIGAAVNDELKPRRALQLKYE